MPLLILCGGLSREICHFADVLQVLDKRDAVYPVDDEGRQKIRATLERSRKMFLTILEDSQKIIVITGGEA